MPDPRELALYVHWPFCQAKCPYCDFNSHVVSAVDHERWRSAFLSELRRCGDELPDRLLTSIFFGGGTPSLMEPETVGAIIETARSIWPTVNDLEVTLEANPTSSEAGKFRRFGENGVNRVSIGLQALNDTDLKALGRLHTAEEGMRAYEMARSVFERCSFDLIYARQHQTESDWRSELEAALKLAPDHLSLYQLTIEPGTAFGDRFDRGLLRGLPGEDLSADLYAATQEICESAGLPAYETSNHARPGAESRHNLTYWKSGDWVGIGPGAHGRFTKGGVRIGTECRAMPMAWLTAAEAGSGELDRSITDPGDWIDEQLLMGLRLRKGIELDRPIPEIAEKILLINSLTPDPLIELNDSTLRLTPAGRPLLNAVLRELLT